MIAGRFEKTVCWFVLAGSLAWWHSSNSYLAVAISLVAVTILLYSHWIEIAQYNRAVAREIVLLLFRRHSLTLLQVGSMRLPSAGVPEASDSERVALHLASRFSKLVKDATERLCPQDVPCSWGKIPIKIYIIMVTAEECIQLTENMRFAAVIDGMELSTPLPEPTSCALKALGRARREIDNGRFCPSPWDISEGELFTKKGALTPSN